MVLLVAVVIKSILNSIKYGGPIGGAAATAVDVGSEIIKATAKSTVNQLQGDTTQTTKPSEQTPEKPKKIKYYDTDTDEPVYEQ